ncbi:MAG: 30S ribosomal protein S3 [Candidatus Wildermuthbacteria bacterium RIFCSPHIGHO2_12_FULL_40_12]|uniref:Small ribosomal subunit protein uS3 n=1 Tax=Candidatus Wildermuthbacteria bacterium RIFCSPHIGHO2_12_FULL_40_12 TaxID=1802457 RepID=A0A1G2RDL5_9BACT|nr:MAG: 30S ribosomal protein S3 [Candidatus Wildermuthbacteria bacterium RIFCSPHIGHO2_12_FULL_40_12]
MSHKVNPKAFRIKEITDWSFRGFYGKKPSAELKIDSKIRDFLKEKLANMAVEKVETEGLREKMNIIITSARPGLIIGRGGGGIEELKKKLESFLKIKDSASPIKELRIEVKEIKDPWSSASLIAQLIAQQIEKRMPFRRVLKQTLDKIAVYKTIQGARIELSGRLDGASIARREWLKKGKLPLQTIRADIDFAKAEAHCSYGAVGIKVWLYKGEKFEK